MASFVYGANAYLIDAIHIKGREVRMSKGRASGGQGQQNRLSLREKHLDRRLKARDNEKFGGSLLDSTRSCKTCSTSRFGKVYVGAKLGMHK